MATSEDQQIRNAILQLLEEYGNTGQIDLQNLPLLQQIIQQQVEQRLPLLTQERTQYLNKLYAQEFKKNLQRNQALTKQELETLQHQQKQLHSRLDLLKRERQKLQQQLNLDQKMARWAPLVILIAVVALILTTLGLIYLTAPLILHGTGFAGIWHFAHPNFSGWGVFRRISAILGCFLLLMLELALILYPTTLVFRFIQVIHPPKVRKYQRYS